MITGGDPALLRQCLDLCQALASKGQKFTLNLIHTGTSFNFSLDTKESVTTDVVIKKKKKASPSTMRRNIKRKEEFLKKKKSPEQETVAVIDSENSSQLVNSFKCNLCEKCFNTEPGLKIHKGKAHKNSDPPPIEQLRDTTEVSSLKGSPAKETPREEQCVCCGEVMSPFHQCSDADEDEEDEENENNLETDTDTEMGDNNDEPEQSNEAAKREMVATQQLCVVRKYKCHKCEEEFGSGERLDDHMAKIHQNQCDQCLKSFTDLSGLIQHMRETRHCM